MDHLTLLILFDSEKDKSQNVFRNVYLPIIHENRDLFKVYAYDCKDPEAQANIETLESCKRPDDLPYMQLYKPPQHRVDPLTLSELKPELIHYTERELTPSNFYNYIIKNLPDYTTRIDNIMLLERFRDGMVNYDMNKVLILSNRRKVNEEYKAISSEFRDRLLVGFVPEDAHEVHA